MNTLEKFEWMRRTQESVNTAISGESWIPLGALAYRIDFQMAAVAELMEFVDSGLGWKWWAKSFTEDNSNSKMELVDVFHFLLSEDCIRGGLDHGERSATLEHKFLLAESLCKAYLAIPTDAETVPSEQDKKFSRTILLKKAVKQLIQSLVTTGMDIDWVSFGTCCYLTGLSINELYSTYLAKATLNVFRKDHGYKEGNYKKTWSINGSVGEDNFHLMAWLRANQDKELSQADILGFLTESYAASL
jgi:dimeric dUTPase (all-alpha-NTP-PPase superfamily)